MADTRYFHLYQDLLNQKSHILIAGATGSGKSVLLNALIHTALIDGKNKLVLLDPKRVELDQYRDLPQCIRYADCPESMVQALQWVLAETERRFSEMKKNRQKEYTGTRILVVIDELADLMLTQRKEVQPVLQRILQLSRAASITVLMATQVPLAKVIPTELKANADIRIGLRTACAQDSRNIVGVKGCEDLPNPRVEHRAQGIIRNGSEITLWNLPTYTQEEHEFLLNYRRREKPQRRGILQAIFGF